MPLGSPLLRPQRCIYCGTLSRHVFNISNRYCCDKDVCLTAALHDYQPDLDDATIRALLPKLRATFTQP